MVKHKVDPEIQAHLEWIGFVRPTGLVVSAPALVRAGAILDRRDGEGQRLLRACVSERMFELRKAPSPYLADFRVFADSVLGWSFSPKGYAGTAESPIPPDLEVPLPDYGETLRPDFAVRELESKDGISSWQLLVQVVVLGEDFDRLIGGHGRFEASPQARMERLLRQTGVSAGLLFNGRALRLVSAPRGESSGWLDFHVEQMLQTAGRPISTAMRLLLSQARLLSLPRPQRLSALLEDSRKLQNEVSEKLAEQVLHALYELLRGFQAAQDRSIGELLRVPLATHPDEVYRGLLTVILRLVFLLFAEERDMLSEEEVFLRNYSVSGLFERLREDAALYPDAMDDRYSAWAQLLVLFRMVYEGAESGAMRLPKRHGVLFDPDRFPFLEGRPSIAIGSGVGCIAPPYVPDGTIHRALEKLLILDGERISYRALDVEQIGSVYETMMGFRLETASGRSIAVRADKKEGAPTAVDLEALLAQAPGKRESFLQEHAERKLSDTIKKAIAAATTLEDLHAALVPVIDFAATPDVVFKGAMVLQPSEERRRSGSHYTPRALTEPIVRTTLGPIFASLRGEDGRQPMPAQILELKICDPTMGSGAFLVEACRQLADELVASWHTHRETPDVPHDEDEVVFARRLIAQRCLYGVDKNPVAVDLAKMSLWLVTLAKDHALTFLDHALRHGDSLVGLSRKQIASFNWSPSAQMGLIEEKLQKTIDTVSNHRRQILTARDDVSYSLLSQKLDAAEDALSLPRQVGNAVIAAFFNAEKDRDRKNARLALSDQLMSDLKSLHYVQLDGEIDAAIAKLRCGPKGIQPFHWELEFPEVFDRKKVGFDAIVGNPPFLHGKKISGFLGKPLCDWLKVIHVETIGTSDLVAHFFRRAFSLVADGGTLGLLATNSISEGDTRISGLRWICKNGGTIFSARRRIVWPGSAAVVVSAVHIMKGKFGGLRSLDDREVEVITAYLFYAGHHDNPATLAANANLSFQGSIVLGMGFTFDDSDKNGVASPLGIMHDIIRKNPKNQERIFPYIGGDELNNSPTLEYHRFVIDFGGMSEGEARDGWPDLMAIVEQKVKPERMKTTGSYKTKWWQFGRRSIAGSEATASKEQFLVTGCGATPHLVFAFMPKGRVLAHSLDLFPLTSYSAFCVLQSRPHEIWARFFGSTLEERLRYTPSDCFETYPFPPNWQKASALEAPGQAYYQFRAALMARNNKGLTKIYNRFHDPNEQDSDILKLRELHAAVDRSVLDAYGWCDIPTVYEFVLDYEIDEEELGKKMRPWRYRWPDLLRDDVLARLLQLNAERAKDEILSGVAAAKNVAEKSSAKQALKKSPTKGLFS